MAKLRPRSTRPRRQRLRQLDDFMVVNEEEWIEQCERLAFARFRRREYLQKLEEGHAGEGILLSQKECWDIMQLILDGEPRKRGRPPPSRKEIETKTGVVAMYSAMLEIDEFPTEAAVTQAATIFKVSRSYVYDARKKWADDEGFRAEIAEFRSNPPEERRRARRMQEIFANYFVSRQLR